MSRTTISSVLGVIALGAFFGAATMARAEEPRVPQSVSDHETLARAYREKATAYQNEAEWHRTMAAAYARAHPDAKGGFKNRWNVKMQKHCQQLAKAARALAIETQKAADFHMLRARELQGK